MKLLLAALAILAVSTPSYAHKEKKADQKKECKQKGPDGKCLDKASKKPEAKPMDSSAPSDEAKPTDEEKE
jgi:hypothetical protein